MLPEEEKIVNKERQRNGLLDYIDYPEIALWKRGVLLALGNVFALSILAVIVLLIFKFAGNDNAQDASEYIIYSIIFVALAAVVIKDIPKIKPLLKRWEPYVVGSAIGILILILDSSYINVINLFYHIETSGNEETIRSAIAAYPVASVFIFGLVGPMVEELTYRSGLFGLLRKWHRIPAYIITGLIFGLIHFQFDSPTIINEFIFLPTYIVPGLLFCLAYDLYGLPCSFTAHSFNNLFAIIAQIITARL